MYWDEKITNISSDDDMLRKVSKYMIHKVKVKMKIKAKITARAFAEIVGFREYITVPPSDHLTLPSRNPA
jgi:hypothetical protein